MCEFVREVAPLSGQRVSVVVNDRPLRASEDRHGGEDVGLDLQKVPNRRRLRTKVGETHYWDLEPFGDGVRVERFEEVQSKLAPNLGRELVRLGLEPVPKGHYCSLVLRP